MRERIEIKGLNELIHGYDGMSRRGVKRAVRSGMRKTASVINKAAKKLAPVGATGMLKKSLGVKVKVYPSGIVVGIVEPRKGFRIEVSSKWTTTTTRKGGKISYIKTRYHDPRKIAHLVEGGTKLRRSYTLGNANRGRVIAKPFLEPAGRAGEAKAIAIFTAEFDKELAKEVPQT